MHDYLAERQQRAQALLRTYIDRVTNGESVSNLGRRLCIYATGSYGREEASDKSDIDLFFVAAQGEKIRQTEKFELFAELIRLNRELKLPDFSRDATFLEVHPYDALLDNIGRPEDDYGNTFTARMLLLLESRCIWKNSLHDALIEAVLNRYFDDYAWHSGDFVPRFFINDLTRFWKTLCLNYEAYRTRDDRSAMRLENLKLRYSRKLTCFSLIVSLVGREAVSPTMAKEACLLTPMQRLDQRAEESRNKEVRQLVDELQDAYSAFLKLCDGCRGLKQDNSPLATEDTWLDAKARSNGFGDNLVKLLEKLGGNDALALVAL